MNEHDLQQNVTPTNVMQQHVFKPDIQFSMGRLQVQVGQVSYGTILHPIPLHSHGVSCYELHYIKEGLGSLYANNRNYELKTNCLFTTGPNVEHAQYSSQTTPMLEYCLYLIIPDHGMPNYIHKFLTTLFWFGEDNEDVCNTMEQIIKELSFQKTAYKEQLQYLISQLIIQMIRNYELGKTIDNTLSSKENSDKKTDKNMEPLNTLDRISVAIEHYFLYEYKELSLGGLSKRLNLSQRQTQRILRQNYKKTFQEKKAEAKMAVASLLLKDEKIHIHVISEELGYSSAEHFSMAFRKYYGYSPREYRLQLHTTR